MGIETQVAKAIEKLRTDGLTEVHFIQASVNDQTVVKPKPGDLCQVIYLRGKSGIF